MIITYEGKVYEGSAPLAAVLGLKPDAVRSRLQDGVCLKKTAAQLRAEGAERRRCDSMARFLPKLQDFCLGRLGSSS